MKRGFTLIEMLIVMMVIGLNQLDLMESFGLVKELSYFILPMVLLGLTLATPPPTQSQT